MPKVLAVGKFVFLVFASDVAEFRRHIHVEVRKGRHRRVAKFWIEPRIELVTAGNLSEKEIGRAMQLIQAHEAILRAQLDAFYQGKTIRMVKL